MTLVVGPAVAVDLFSIILLSCREHRSLATEAYRIDLISALISSVTPVSSVHVQYRCVLRPFVSIANTGWSLRHRFCLSRRVVLRSIEARPAC